MSDDPEVAMKCLIVSLMAAALAACGSPHPKHSSGTDPEAGPRKVERDYAKPVAEVWRAARAALEDLQLTLDDDRHDQLGGTIVARRATGDRLTVEVAGLDEHRSRVVVQVDPGTETLAITVHDKITEHLGLSKAKTSHFGGNSASGRYTCTLSRAASAAEQVVRKLGLELLSIDVREEQATVEARNEVSLPIGFAFTRVDPETLKALFTVGTSPSPGARATARRLKSEFERELLPPLEQ